jgi:hypothetical protein
LLKGAAIFANNINESGWNIFGTALIDRLNVLSFQNIHQGTADGRMNEWMNGWLGRWMNGWMDG